jgi:hypothetical protein
VKIALVIIILLVIALPVSLLLVSNGTELKIDPPVTAIGTSTPVQVRVDNPHGIRRFTAIIEQNGTRYTVVDLREEAHRWMFWRSHQGPQIRRFQAGKQQAPALHDGKARLIVEAQSNDLRGRTDSVEADVQIILEPPRVSADGAQHYINQGGSELVVFTPGGYVTDSGVRVGKYEFRSFPHPSGHGQRFSLFAYPWDLAGDVVPVVFARNPAGTEATARFWYKLFPKKFRSRDRRRVSRESGQPDRAGRLGRPAHPLPEDQRRNAQAEQQDDCRPAPQDRRPLPMVGPVFATHECRGRIQLRRPAQLHLQGEKS